MTARGVTLSVDLSFAELRQIYRLYRTKYRSFVTNSYNNITSGTSFDSLINSGIDTCPATIAPLSLTNLQVSVGGQNVLQSTLNMTYENFLDQVNLAEQ